MLEAGRTPRKLHFGQGQRRKQINEATVTSVRGSVENRSTKHTLRIPKESEVRRTYLCLRFNREIILQPKFIALTINLHSLIESDYHS